MTQYTLPGGAPFGDVTDDELRAFWRKYGGSFHGPNIETGTMPEAALLPLLRYLITMVPITDPTKDVAQNIANVGSCQPKK